MFRRDFVAGMSGGLLLAALPGCKPSASCSVGIHPWPGYEPLYLAEHFGWLPSTAALRKGNSASESLAGLRAGTLDGAALTLMRCSPPARRGCRSR